MIPEITGTTLNSPGIQSPMENSSVRMNEISVSKKRINVLDALRGFALLGIGITHYLHGFYTNSLPGWLEKKTSTGISQILLELDYKLVVGKFFTLFCFLFGVSFTIQKKGFLNKKGSFSRWYGKRMVILFLIGILHYLFWRGDILMSYGVFGICLLPLTRIPKKGQLVLIIILALGLPRLIFDYSPGWNSVSNPDFILQEKIKSDYFFSLIQKGSFWEIISANAHYFSDKIEYLIGSGRMFTTLGIFLMGAWIGETGLFQNFEENKRDFFKLFKISSLGLAGIVLFNLAYQKFTRVHTPVHWMASVSFILNNLNNLILTAWYVEVFCLAYYYSPIQKILKTLEPMGKLAISNYLFQTILGVLIFYKFGMGLFLKSTTLANLFIALVIFGFEIYLSILWLKRFKYGPIEGLWRYLTQLNWSLNYKRKA
jgi:uncharacterized protein